MPKRRVTTPAQSAAAAKNLIKARAVRHTGKLGSSRTAKGLRPVQMRLILRGEQDKLKKRAFMGRQKIYGHKHSGKGLFG